MCDGKLDRPHPRREGESATIVEARSVSSFFSDAVKDAIRFRGLDATDGAMRYVVALLGDYAHPDTRAGEALDRPLTLLLDEAMRVSDAGERFERLRALGDGVLYGCGFFADHFEARGVDPKYLHGLGRRAYDAASSMLRRGAEDTGCDLFAELVAKFGGFVDVLSSVADATIAMSTETSRGLVKAYERWLKTGSERLAAALTSQGVMPVRVPRGVLQ